MTFEQFTASRRYVIDLGVELGLDDYNGKAGYVYASDELDSPLCLVTEHDGGYAYLEYPMGELWAGIDEAERALYDYAIAEGFFS